MLSLLVYVFMVFLCTTFLLLSAIALVLCAPFDRSRRVVHWLSRVMVWIFFYVARWRRCVEGLENLDPRKSYVIVMNHNAMMDIPILYLLPLNFRWVSKREVFRIPFFGQFLILHGDIAIERGSGSHAMEQVLREGCKWLSRGASVAIFPEGTRSKSGEIGRFKAGAFTLAQQAGVEVLPVVIDGTRDMIQKGGRMNWKSELKMRVLPPLSVESIEPQECRKVMDRVHTDMCDALRAMREQK